MARKRMFSLKIVDTDQFLDKATPMKVLNNDDEYWSNCPVCDNVLYEKELSCEKCEQKLDWVKEDLQCLKD